MNIYFKEFYSNNIIKLDIKSNEYYNDSTKNFTLKLLKLFISKKYNLILDMIDILENNILCKDYDKIINFSNIKYYYCLKTYYIKASGSIFEFGP